MASTNQRNFAVSKETESKLFQLRNYHNSTYNKLFEVMVENAFMSMNEAINLNKGKELEEQNLKVGFQVQQLTLMFSELKKELAEVKTENSNLKESIEKVKKEGKDFEDKLNKEVATNKGRSERYSTQISEINKWISNKDKSWIDKLKG